MKSSNFAQYSTRKISDTVWNIYDDWNDLMYLVKGRDKCLLIDTSFGLCDLNKLCKELAPLPLTVVLTHAHPDHAMGAGQFKSVYLNNRDIDLFKGVNSVENRRNSVEMIKKENKAFSDLNQIIVENWINSGMTDTIDICDGDVFELGGRTLMVIATPGHTKGSICLLDEEEGRLFAGDTIVNCNHLLALPESDTIENFYNSLKHLKESQHCFNIIHPGHVKAPLEVKKLDELFEGVENILDGKNVGKRIEHDLCGTSIEYSFGEDNTLIGHV